jgi:hypothetical protein
MWIVAVDRSFSMGAQGTFARALDLARQNIDRSSPGERVAVIAFDARADVIAAPGSAGEARSALSILTPGFGSTRYAAAFAKAAEVADGSPGDLVIVTDMQRSGWDEQQPQTLPATLQVHIADTGAPPPNLAIIHVTTRPDGIIATVRNTGAAPRNSELRAAIDGREIASARFVIPAASAIDVAAACRVPDSGALAVSIRDGTGYSADDVRYSILDAAARPRVLIVASPAADGPSGFYVSRALEVAGAGETGFSVKTVSGAELSHMSADDLSASAAVVLLSTRGVDRDGRARLASFVRQGGGLLVAAAPGVDPPVLSTLFEWRSSFTEIGLQPAPVALAPTDLRHPIFGPLGPLAANLGQARFARGWRVQGTGWDVAARFTDGTPALLERREGSGVVVLFASDLDRRWNDFPLHPAFVPFAVESVRYITRPENSIREYLVDTVPAGVPPHPGLFRTQPQNRLAAVNVDPRESATERLTPEEFERAVRRIENGSAASATPRAQQAESRQNLWQYGLALMLLSLVAESFVGRA